MSIRSNRLINETSPYLLQHAHNPVDWYPWGEEALEKARAEDKPILVSIGYAACHWCHVMEKESFEDEATAQMMNAHFINIKIDREERPDLDHIYMDAVQAMTGSGGWPLNVFLLPNAKPFYGGTYFPPEPAFNKPSWKNVLQGIAGSYKEKRDQIESQANQLIGHLEQANGFGINAVTTAPAGLFTKETAESMCINLLKTADTVEGGFGRAPKFPQTFSIRFLLQHYYFSGNEAALKQACLSLDKMIDGGIYDQLAGGWARYATDNEWLIPHFEKMLYDNALLLGAVSDAYSLTRNEKYRKIIVQTMGFVEKDWLSPEGGFFAAYDADSEGVEGKYYVWDKDEIDKLLGADAEVFSAYYDITERGNWEHSNILHVNRKAIDVAIEFGLTEDAFLEKMDACKIILLKYRTQRVPPLLDDKLLLSWNAMMVQACCQTFAATGIEKYREMGVKAMEFIWSSFRQPDGFYHSFKNGQAKHPAFLDDYACLVQALIHLQEVTADSSYLDKAREITEEVIRDFSELETGFFFFTPANRKDIIVRKKEVYDGATPSGNALMAVNLFYLGVVYDLAGWRNRGEKMLLSLEQAVIRYPGSFGVWAGFLQALIYGIPEIALIGPNFRDLHLDFLRIFTPLRVFQTASKPDNRYPLLANKPETSAPQFYLCKQYSCQKPVNEVDSLVELMKNV